MSVVRVWHENSFTHVSVDGHELSEVTGIQLNFPVDGRVEAHIGLAPSLPIDYEMPMDVHLHVHIPEGCTVLDVTTHGDGGKRLLVVRRPEDPR